MDKKTLRIQRLRNTVEDLTEHNRRLRLEVELLKQDLDFETKERRESEKKIYVS